MGGPFAAPDAMCPTPNEETVAMENEVEGASVPRIGLSGIEAAERLKGSVEVPK